MSLSLAAACDCARSISKPWKAGSRLIFISRASFSTSTASPAASISKPLGLPGGLRDTRWLELNRRPNERSKFSPPKIAGRAGGGATSLCRSCAKTDRAQLPAQDGVLSLQTDRAHSVSDKRRGDHRRQSISRDRPEIAPGKCGWFVPNAATGD